MFVNLTVLEPPAVEPVSLALFKQHLRIDHDLDDTLLPTYLTSARALAEDYMARVLITQQLRFSMTDSPPGAQWPLSAVTPVILPLWLPFPLLFNQAIRLPRSPVQSIDRVAISVSGQLNDRVLSASTDYTSDVTNMPGRLLLSASSQPALGQHVAIDFTAGYSTDGTGIPQSILNAILFAGAWLYEHRGDDAQTELPNAFYSLLTPYRLVSFGG